MSYSLNMNKKLLIVDDCPEVTEVVKETLAGLFTDIHCAANVDAAIGALGKTKFDFVVLDINLEGRNGAEVIKFLVDSPENPNKVTPFIIISGIITPQFVQKYGQRFAGVLMKPFDQSELINIVESILGNVPPAPRLDDIPLIKCDLPFPIIQLQQRVNKVMEGVRKSGKLKELFAKMTVNRDEENYILNHIGILVNISTGISIQMDWNTDKTLEKFVYAAYLHDMALSSRPELAKISTFEELEAKKAELSEAEYKLVLEHPAIACRSLEDYKEVPPDVATIIKQHHELPKGTGFPTKMTFSKISPLAAVFIVAHDMTDYILKNPQWTMEAYLKEARMRMRGGHFTKVLRALEDLH